MAAGAFKTTSWSVVLAAKNDRSTVSREALEVLCRCYWSPLYSYIRHKGHSVENSKDLTQGFFANFLEKRFLKDVEPAKGRFRSFLLASLNHYLANERAKKLSLKRGGAVPHLPLDFADAEQRYVSGPPHNLSPEALFDAEWARTTIESSLQRLESEYAEAGKSELYDGLRGYLSGEFLGLPYKELARNLKTTEGAVKVAVHRMRKRYGSLLRDAIADTVEKPEEVDEELRYLASVAGL